MNLGYNMLKAILTYVVTEISIHENNILILAPVKTVNVSRTESKLTSSGGKNDLVTSVNLLQFFDTLLSTIRRGVIDNDNFHRNRTEKLIKTVWDLLFLGALHQKVDDKWQVLTLIVSGQDDADAVFAVE